jgi:hypothetical protein
MICRMICTIGSNKNPDLARTIVGLKRKYSENILSEIPED